ncbi:MAG: Ig-like domain-containing protein, partial [Akkermansiaceae bacterium]
MISCPDLEAEIRYTVNGTEPTLNDQKVESGETIIINRNWIVKAKAWVAGVESATTTGDFILTGDIVAGASHSLALSAMGNASAWGLQTSGRLANGASAAANISSPVVAQYSSGPITDATMLAAGGSHSLFLKYGGTVWAAGLNSSGQIGDNTTTLQTLGVQVKKSTGATDYLTECIGIAAGDNFSLALAANGEVWAWGSNISLGNGTTTGTRLFAGKVYSGTTGTVPLAGIGRISANGGSSLALESATGNVWAWGVNTNGQLGQGNVTNLSRASRVKLNSTTFLTDAFDISNGKYHSVVVRWKSGDPALQGRVYCFGQQQNGRLGNNNTAAANVTYPVQVVKSGGAALDGIVSVAAGPAHTLALDLNGNVWAWGSNSSGALGDNTTLNSGVAIKVKNPAGTADLANIVRIAAGGTEAVGHSLAVAADGSVYAWGSNVNGQLGNGVANSIAVKLPVVVGGNLDLLLQAPSVTFSANLTQGVAPGSVLLSANPTDSDNNVHKVEFYCQGKLAGTAYSAPWQVTVGNLAAGSNQAYAKVIDSTGLYGTSVPVNFTVTSSLTSADHDRDGLPNTWELQYGLNPESAYGNDGPDGDQDGDGFSNFWEYIQDSAPNDPNSQPKGMVSSRADNTCAVATDGRVWSWGLNSNGLLGDGTTLAKSSPVLVPKVMGMKRIIKVETGENFTLALDVSGCLWGWGSNNYNVLSSTATTRFLSPIKLGFKTPISDFSCGSGHVIATDREGKIWVWGYNNYGQLGLGHSNTVLAPTELSRPSGMSEVITVEASIYSCYAVDSTGKVWSWGYNSNGRLGDGTITSRNRPVAVSLTTGMPTIRSISSTDGHALALGTDGTLWAWGYNAYGQLGNGNTTSSSTPVFVSSGFSMGTQIAAGANHSMLISQTGQVWCWGRNTYGQLGNGTTTNSHTPVLSSAVTDWNSLIMISAGKSHSFALKSDGSLWSWGYNYYGQLGHGNTSSLMVPTKLLNLKLCQDDTESDGMSDSFEKFYFGNLSQIASGVYSAGGVTNSIAYSKGLNPLIIDNDKDGLPDVTELASGLDPLDWTDASGDADGDRIPNLWEHFMASSMLNSMSKPSVNATVTAGQSIQTAINAITGNTTNPPWVIIQVGPGVYNERITLPSNKRILLISNHTGIPEIRGPSGSGAIYATGECVIDGFRITHGKDSTGEGVEFALASDKLPVRISNCFVHGNSGNSLGGGAKVNSGSRVVVSHCSFFRNSATSEGNAVYVSSSTSAHLINTILWNPSGSASKEIYSSGMVTSESSYVGDGSVSGSIPGNPLINPLGFLTKASPARYAGSPKSGTRFDIQNEFRGNLPDIGADQFMDSDNDGLPNSLESQGITAATADNDLDGLNNLQEYEITASSPTIADHDGDGLNDGAEVSAGSDVFDTDTDTDGMADGKEVQFGLSPLDDSDALKDMDGDRIPNVFETANNTLPNSATSFPAPFITVDPLIVTETTTTKKTIQAAINSTNNPSSGYKIIRVKNGTYAESVLIDSRKILLLGDLGFNPPVISPVSGDALRINENSGVIDGFWLRRNTSNSVSRGVSVSMDKDKDQCRILNCKITGFTNSSASAMNVSTGRTSLVHCTLMDNSGSVNSRAISVSSGCKLFIQNSILWNIDKGAANEIYELTAGSTTVTTSIIRGGAFGAISSQPLTDRYHCLMSGSPAIAAGTKLPVASKDIHGESRAVSSPDIGADQRLDSDSDSLPDWWEIQYFGNLTKTSTGDNDSPVPDRLTNWYEYLLGLNPLLATTPGSGFSDLYHAIYLMQEDPWYPQEWWLDQDSDGLTDNYELYHGTNPLLPDTNGDGVSDLLAVLSGISPTAGDTDGDGMSNALEILNGTDPLLMDTDGDGVHDNLDAFPLDASRSQPVSGSPSDITPPLISLLEPIGA